VIVGTITELNTTGLTVNAELYVASAGGLTATPPTARAQPVARVERVNANNGAIIVKVNGLSASDATGNTLVRRTSGGGVSLGQIFLSGSIAPAASGQYDIGLDDTPVKGVYCQTMTVANAATFNATTYNYGTGAASAHRIALGAGTTGAALFGAADAAAARTTLGLATTDTPTFAGVTTAKVASLTSLRLAATLSGVDAQRIDLSTAGLTRITVTTNNVQRIGIQNGGQIDVSSPVVSTSNVSAVNLTASGNVGIGTTSPTALLDVNSDTVRIRTARTPASAAAAGNAGDICWDADYIYVCTATNTWKRTAISTWP